MFCYLGGKVSHHADCQNMSVNDILNNDAFILMQQDPCNTENGDQYQMMLGNYILSTCDYCNNYYNFKL